MQAFFLCLFCFYFVFVCYGTKWAQKKPFSSREKDERAMEFGRKINDEAQRRYASRGRTLHVIVSLKNFFAQNFPLKALKRASLGRKCFRRETAVSAKKFFFTRNDDAPLFSLCPLRLRHSIKTHRRRTQRRRISFSPLHGGISRCKQNKAFLGIARARGRAAQLPRKAQRDRSSSFPVRRARRVRHGERAA